MAERLDIVEVAFRTLEGLARASIVCKAITLENLTGQQDLSPTAKTHLELGEQLEGIRELWRIRGELNEWMLDQGIVLPSLDSEKLIALNYRQRERISISDGKLEEANGLYIDGVTSPKQGIEVKPRGRERFARDLGSAEIKILEAALDLDRDNGLLSRRPTSQVADRILGQDLAYTKMDAFKKKDRRKIVITQISAGIRRLGAKLRTYQEPDGLSDSRHSQMVEFLSKLRQQGFEVGISQIVRVLEYQQVRLTRRDDLIETAGWSRVEDERIEAGELLFSEAETAFVINQLLGRMELLGIAIDLKTKSVLTRIQTELRSKVNGDNAVNTQLATGSLDKLRAFFTEETRGETYVANEPNVYARIFLTALAGIDQETSQKFLEGFIAG